MDINNYLINDGQSEINDSIKEFCSSIPNIKCIDDFAFLDKKFYDYFTCDRSTPKFCRSATDIFNSKTFSGCSDIGLIIASILREKGIPTRYVETAKVDWLNLALNNLPGNECMQGHIFLEVYINGEWYLYDPTCHVIYKNYDETNNNYPRGYYVFLKGMDPNSNGVNSVKDERASALNILKDYDYTKYVDPMYPEISLKRIISLNNH